MENQSKQINEEEEGKGWVDSFSADEIEVAKTLSSLRSLIRLRNLSLPSPPDTPIVALRWGPNRRCRSGFYNNHPSAPPVTVQSPNSPLSCGGKRSLSPQRKPSCSPHVPVFPSLANQGLKIRIVAPSLPTAGEPSSDQGLKVSQVSIVKVSKKRKLDALKEEEHCLIVENMKLQKVLQFWKFFLEAAKCLNESFKKEVAILPSSTNMQGTRKTSAIQNTPSCTLPDLNLALQDTEIGFVGGSLL